MEVVESFRSLDDTPSADLQHFALPLSSLLQSSELRMDASHFDPAVIEAINALYESGMRVESLGSLVDRVFMPSRFKRVYVDADEGIPFLQGSHVVHFRPDDVKYLSTTAHSNIDQLVVRKGWLLVTRSGTVGRAVICSDDWDGWAASEHIIRVIPNEERCPGAYLATFLSSSFGQVQLTSNIYGAVVDELTEQHMRNVLVPIPISSGDWQLVKSIDRRMRKAMAKKAQAVELVSSVLSSMPNLASTKTPQISNDFVLSSRYIFESENVRMDANSYSPKYFRALEALEDGGMPLVPLRSLVTEVFMPNRFKRIYVESEQGSPFLQGSHVVHFQPSDIKFLSSNSYSNFDELRIEQDWLLMTRSGTVGRTVICPKEWSGWTATEDIIRIVPNEGRCPKGYLFAFLNSTLGQAQLTSMIHGAVIDHLTEENVRDVLVPVPISEADKALMADIDVKVEQALTMRSNAVAAARKAVEAVEDRLGEVA